MKNGLIYSLIGHVFILLFLGAKFNLRKPPRIDLTTAVRVDMVGLPDKKNDVALPTKNQSPIPETKKNDLDVKEKKVPEIESKDISLKKTKQKQQDALKKLQKMSAIEKIKADLANEKPKLVSAPIKGEVISAGTRPTGLSRIEYDSFLGQIDATIKNNWALPQWLINLNLQARVKVKIDPSGQLISKEINRSSGNPSYDEYCLAAVEKSAPFPAVPEKFSEIFKLDGFLVGFPD
jgi:colicin import membrane protein